MLAEREPGRPLSYLELVEVAIVATLRELGVKLGAIRRSHQYLAKRFETPHPFARVKIMTTGAEVLYDIREYEGPWARQLVAHLVDASREGQVVWQDPIVDRIKQFDHDDILDLFIRWHPRGREVPIIVDPHIQFGAPILENSGIATFALRERRQAGEAIQEIAADFGIDTAEVLRALEFEGIQAAAAAA